MLSGRVSGTQYHALGQTYTDLEGITKSKRAVESAAWRLHLSYANEITICLQTSANTGEKHELCQLPAHVPTKLFSQLLLSNCYKMGTRHSRPYTGNSRDTCNVCNIAIPVVACVGMCGQGIYFMHIMHDHILMKGCAPSCINHCKC